MIVRRRAGMTLVELIVAITVGGLALAAGYGALSTMVDLRGRATAATESVARDVAIRRALASWLAGARLTVGESPAEFNGLDARYGKLADGELTFLTTAATPIGSAETVVRLFVDRDSTTRETGLTAELRSWRGTRSQRIEIEPRVVELRFSYLTGVLGGRRWIHGWTSTSMLPAAVELTVSAAAGDSLPPLLRHPLIVAFEGGG